jgi:Ca2+-binding EF-hand superfamily protein
MSNNKKEEPELNAIIEGFRMLGSENNGLVNPNDLKEIMETMNMQGKNPFLYNIIKNFCRYTDFEKKDGIEAEDFISQLDQEIDNISSMDEVEKLFSIFSNPMTNTIPLKAFSEITNIKGENEEEEKLKNLISKSQLIDKELDIKEFNNIVQLEPPKKNIEHNDKIIYKKKSCEKDGKETRRSFKKNNTTNFNSNNVDNNIKNKNNKNNIVKNGDINANGMNTIITNNNSNLNSINIFDSINSSDKNSEMYTLIKKKPIIIYDENINQKIKIENLSSIDINNKSNDINNEEMKYYFDNVDKDENNFDNNYNFNDINENNNMKKEVVKEEIALKKYNYIVINDNNENEDIIDNEDEERSDRGKFRYVKPYGEINGNIYEEIDDNKDENGNGKTKREKLIIDNYTKNEKILTNDTEEKNIINGQEKNDIITNKRYHRRYRETKSNTPDRNEKKMNHRAYASNDGNGKINTGHSKYRRKI